MTDTTAEYIFYAVTMPTRVGRRIVGRDIHATKSGARKALLADWPDSRCAEKFWRERRAAGWRIEPVLVTLLEDVQ